MYIYIHIYIYRYRGAQVLFGNLLGADRAHLHTQNILMFYI